MSMWVPDFPLIGDDIWRYCLHPYTDQIGAWFWVIVAGALVSMTYIKTQSYEIPTVLLLMCSLIGVITLPAGLVKYIAVASALACAVALVRFYKS